MQVLSGRGAGRARVAGCGRRSQVVGWAALSGLWAKTRAAVSLAVGISVWAEKLIWASQFLAVTGYRHITSLDST